MDKPLQDKGRKVTAEKAPEQKDGGAMVVSLSNAKAAAAPAVQPKRTPLPVRPKRPKEKEVQEQGIKRFQYMVQNPGAGASRSLLGFVLVTVLPTVLAALYFCFVASPQYVSEFRFSVRPGDSGPGMSASVEAALIMSNSFIVSDYVVSRDAVTEMEKTVGLKDRFTKADIDPLSRMKPDGSIEDLVDYWKGRVTTTYDMSTGINVVAVTAFSPQDAYDLASHLKLLTEHLVNDLSEQARQTQMGYAQTELDRATDRLSSLRDQATSLMTAQKTIDARKEATGKMELMARLRSNLADLQQQYYTLSSYLNQSSPKIGVVKNQIEATQQQIAALSKEITGDADSASQKTDAISVAKFDEIQTEIEMATKLWESALTSYEQARIKASTNHLFLATYVQPSVPETAAYPRKFIDTLLFFLAACAVWVVLTLIFYSVRDHA